ncbi:hypothetical protein [Kosakonia pseudosacchari]|nr:hypothetical protein [Kosakonia pseudosacchari]
MEQSLNFEMLRSQWAELACMAERYVPSAPESRQITRLLSHLTAVCGMNA